MKIALINVSGRLSSDGSRLISALLKRANHQVVGIFFARPHPMDYQPDELERLDEILRGVDLVMIAVYSSYAIRAAQVTEFVHTRYPGMKVIWGGPHCVSAPELGLRYADGVCFSEGDEVVVELVEKMARNTDFLDTPNMAFNVNGAHVVNKVLPPFSDLDGLPYYDYDLDDQFLLDRTLYQITKQTLEERLAGYPDNIPILYLLTSRGCPHHCSYCNNCRYTAMFGQNTMRFQSVDRIIAELKHTLGRLDFFKLVGFGDDDFFMRPKEELEDFARQYKRSVGLPFGIAVSARTYQREKTEILLDAGLKIIQMGVQSASQRVLDGVYDRKIKISKTTQAIQEIAPYRKTHGLRLLLDFIIDNPYETQDDIIQTYQYLLDLPLHVRVNVFFLAFFPGTPIYNRALRDGIVQPFSEKAFRFYTRSRIRYQKNYETFLILLIRYLRRHRRFARWVPRLMLRALGSSPFRGFASVLPKSLYAYLSRVIQ
jgi:radical SAM superfamily enzyme YgiQ (UPF0313 family)